MPLGSRIAPTAALHCALESSMRLWKQPTASLHCALESSMRLWKQPSSGRSRQCLFTANGGSGGTGGTMAFVDSKLDAALDYSWSLPLDEQTSSSSGSNGSRTPSPQQSSSSGYNSACSSAGSSFSPPPEMYSRKVFVGGLPPDIAQDEIRDAFIQFGGLTVDWPHKAQSKAYFPPKGYAFLLFREEVSVHRLVKSCLSEDGKLYKFVSSLTQTNKKVQIRPWRLNDSDDIMDHTQPKDARKTIFIGGVPRPLKACELADIFNSRYGNVCYAGIDCDPDLKYPKGAGRVTFSSRVSFMSAVSCRFLHVTYGDIDKKVEVKPYVLDDQVCDECHGLNCGGRYAPYFCGNSHCLRYYCEHCWATVHAAPGTQNHRCFSKPRMLPKAALLAAATSCRH